MGGMYGMKRYEVTLMLDGQVVYSGRVRSKSKQAAIVNVLTNKYKGNFDTTHVKEVIDITHELGHAHAQFAEASEHILKAQKMLTKVLSSEAMDKKDVEMLAMISLKVDYVALVELCTKLKELEGKY
ncbi:hypothetical protein [Bacillus phage Nachito]|nr:hypothetical protein [Bacillus phage Nachito]